MADSVITVLHITSVGSYSLFLLNDTATTEIYTLSLHDALPISHTCRSAPRRRRGGRGRGRARWRPRFAARPAPPGSARRGRSEEHTSELQSRQYLVCRLLLEKKNLSFTNTSGSITELQKNTIFF